MQAQNVVQTRDDMILSETEAAFVSVAILAIMNGIHFVTFLLCLRWQIYSDVDWKIRKGISWSMIVITILIFALSVTNLGICLGSFLFAMHGNSDLVLTGILAAFQDAVITLGSIIADGVLTYRCWVVYNKWWPITVLPSVLLLYNFSTLISVSYWNSIKVVEAQTSPYTLITQWKLEMEIQEGYLIATIILNSYTTSAIIIHIFRNSMPSRRTRSALLFAIRVVAESGLLYTVTGIAVLVAVIISLSPDGPQLPLIMLVAIFFPLPGITYDLLWIRVALNRVEGRSIPVDEYQLTTIGDKRLNAERGEKPHRQPA